MHLGLLGINHKSADLKFREELARICEQRLNPIFSLSCPYVLLSTCNRLEIYFSSTEPANTHSQLLNFFRRSIPYPFEHQIYTYFGKDCLYHLSCVTAGLDSAILGETEIQGQVKSAYEKAQTSQTLPPELHFLFQKALKLGKQARALFAKQPLPSLQETILRLAATYLDKGCLFIGLSEINLKLMREFQKRGVTEITLTNRTEEKAIRVGQEEGYHHLPWKEMRASWTEYSLLIFATSSPDYLLSKEEMQPLRDNKLLIDLSVPRNVDPKLGAHPNIKLLNIDQLTRTLDQKIGDEAAKMQRTLLKEAAGRYCLSFKAKQERVVG